MARGSLRFIINLPRVIGCIIKDKAALVSPESLFQMKRCACAGTFPGPRRGSAVRMAVWVLKRCACAGTFPGLRRGSAA